MRYPYYSLARAYDYKGRGFEKESLDGHVTAIGFFAEACEGCVSGFVLLISPLSLFGSVMDFTPT
jgi:hypothetical protein